MDIQLALSVDPTVPEIELPPIKIRNILMVYRELLNNTIKHSQAKKVTINIQYKEPILSIQIADNGIGFDTQGNFKNNNGLKIIQDRMNEIEADINTTSEKNTGTTTTVLIPINNMAML